MKWKVRELWIALAILLLMQLGLSYSWKGMTSKAEIHSTGVLERIRGISELSTVEMYFHEILDFQDAKYFREIEIPFTKKSFIFTVKAKVKAGIDLSLMKDEDIEVIDGKTIRVRLPESRITSKEILEYNSYHEKDGLFNEVRNQDVFNALEQLKEDLESQAIEMKILEQAEKNAHRAISQLLLGIGFEEVVFE
ncbi:DUF4230 domain-containing protein [Geosporobacter ferrireducens]|uniref:DUF4230 domain-containing protein n=1 Tax=Geosporobacter ferrireducens TaxID=1424294 RepID=A0A1D8GH60_9FIRM|nr:DUF4230 domain-containing protein [Geosporobacter ferrireducens]AOT70246.1 hypothetical protein Gferi_11965 [Geosporobacter ferrireducens]MTI55793.1 DUF4230 domain-containing protein [Geosporobacter ferrireducens]